MPVWEAVQARSRFGVDVIHGRAARSSAAARARSRWSTRSRARASASRSSSPSSACRGSARAGSSTSSSRASTERELVYWRQGRCLPYGEGVTFWALGEMVKAQGHPRDGLARGDRGEARPRSPRVVPTRTRPTGSSVAPATARGPRGGRGTSGADAAARRSRRGGGSSRRSPRSGRSCSCSRTSTGPTTACSTSSTTSSTGLTDVPLLVVATARPELLERRPGWGGGKANATTISLAPLSDEDTARLVHALLETSVLAAELQSTLLERAGGNPLYAEEFVRMLAERGQPRARRCPSPCRASSRPGSTGSIPRTRSCSRTPP